MIFFSLKYKQKHPHLWSLAKELVCFVGIVTAVGVKTVGLPIWMFMNLVYLKDGLNLSSC